MRTLNIMICSNDELTEQQMAQRLTDEGVKVQTSNYLISGLYAAQQEWDFLLIDLDGLNSFLRNVVPVVRRRYPHLPIVGIWTKSADKMNGRGSDYGLDLDAYLSEIPRPEDLIVNFPEVATKYYHLLT
jgi:DNA-binding response OmpR family regulator